MAVLPLRSILSPEERQQKQKLIVRDSLTLLSLFTIAVVLFFITHLLYHSFSAHRQELQARWQARGEAAMHAGHPKAAVEALRSAIAYAPDDDTLQIELAESLAAAGRTDEAVAYFNTLLETQPGSGIINLQLAQLAAKQGNEALALEHYQVALDGTWEGDGYVRRREVRLEMARYLIDRKRYEQARTQLLIAAGNAPDDAGIQIGIAGMLESAQDPANALQIYRKAMQHRPVPLAALEGAGRAAYKMGRYMQAKEFLERTLNHPAFEHLPEDAQVQYRNMLADSDHILLLYAGPGLDVRARAQRILTNRKIAQDRLAECLNGNPPPALQSITDQWQQLPKAIRLLQLEQDPELEQKIMKLVLDTEIVTSQACGTPTGNDALLLKIAQAPEAIEQ